MIFRFDDFELDTALREVRRGGRQCALQPKAYDVLEYLVRHHDRVVSKEELLDRLWPGVVVSDASIQRAVSLLRSAIDDDGRLIRTVPRRGYRFVAAVEAAGPTVPPALRFRPRFVVSGDVHIAYHLVGEGEGDLDIVIIPGWVFPLRAFFDHPEVEAWVSELARFGRVILFDKRGTGLSDRVKKLPTLQERGDDLRAVLDASRSRSAVLVGISEGGPLSIFAAASFPERVRGLLIMGSFARWSMAADYNGGWSPERFDELRRYIGRSWGRGDTVRAIAESRGDDPTIAAWAARAEQEGASPGAALDLLEMNLELDVRAILPAVGVPTVVMHSRHDPLFPIENARYLAAHIPGARLVEVDAPDHTFLFEGAGEFRDALAWLIEQPSPAPASFLTTVLALDVGEGTEPSGLEDLAARHGGVPAHDRLAWSFDGPQRAIRCARVLLASAPARAGRFRVGVHTGEVVRQEGTLRGQAIETARAIARAAAPGEIWVSRVVRDLVPGSAFHFAERGQVRLAAG
jgi:DNA-binding winged helix-turn-helix (wHTH) protein/pimeloyl-ACP methyl ester carboxylesterase